MEGQQGKWTGWEIPHNTQLLMDFETSSKGKKGHFPKFCKPENSVWYPAGGGHPALVSPWIISPGISVELSSLCPWWGQCQVRPAQDTWMGATTSPKAGPAWGPGLKQGRVQDLLPKSSKASPDGDSR